MGKLLERCQPDVMPMPGTWIAANIQSDAALARGDWYMYGSVLYVPPDDVEAVRLWLCHNLKMRQDAEVLPDADET